MLDQAVVPANDGVLDESIAGFVSAPWDCALASRCDAPIVIAGDTLNFGNQNDIIGSYDSGARVLTLSGIACLANYQSALDSITYDFSPSDADPTASGTDPSRSLDWTVNDGVAASAIATSTLDIVLAAPTLVASSTVAFTINGSAVALDPLLTLADPDSGGTLSGATVAISGGGFAVDQDLLSAPVGETDIIASYDPTNETLTLSGTDTLANYQAVLRSVTYDSSSSDPIGGGAYPTRTVSWSLDDGVAASAVATTGVSSRRHRRRPSPPSPPARQTPTTTRDSW